ncbi:hypothetical protein PTTG_08362 [Puccinia triticina 1-1 BBBD Race 1]|uniref:Uncharacterized protein n=1 Tax=Puccinia triticina (isolate 1-1 / race 1 (BBBD)) TaxID=630390 RepID=A0A180G8U7_PUCT1|nr:hypothetical protein PTTG_08362 [Puccinia triticina 1-1 BBBD Race 1]
MVTAGHFAEGIKAAEGTSAGLRSGNSVEVVTSLVNTGDRVDGLKLSTLGANTRFDLPGNPASLPELTPLTKDQSAITKEQSLLTKEQSLPKGSSNTVTSGTGTSPEKLPAAQELRAGDRTGPHEQDKDTSPFQPPNTVKTAPPKTEPPKTEPPRLNPPRLNPPTSKDHTHRTLLLEMLSRPNTNIRLSTLLLRQKRHWILANHNPKPIVSPQGSTSKEVKGTFPNTRQTKALEAPELEATLPKRPLLSRLQDRFRLRVENPRRPPSHKEKADFDRFKLDIARAFDDEKYGYSLGNGKEFTPENFGELLDQEMKARTVSHPTDGARVVTKEDYVGYLEDLRLLVKNDDPLTKAKTALAKLESLGEPRVNTQIMEDVTKAMKRMKKQNLPELTRESDAAVKSLERLNLKLEKPLAEYFKAPAINPQKFAAARSIQVNPEKSVGLAKPIFSTAEEVMHTLPAELDLTKELYRYSLIQGFEEVLSEVRTGAQKNIREMARLHMQEAVENDATMKPLIANYIEKMGEADFQRLTRQNPAKIFHTLEEPDPTYATQVYVQQLFKRNLIDEPTRTRLTSQLHLLQTGAIKKTEFVEALGTQEEFTQLLISKLKQEAAARVLKPSIEKVETQGASLLAESYMEAFDNHARSLYLTKDAFEQPGALKFDEAAKTYQPRQWLTHASINDRERLAAKAYVEAHYDVVPQETVVHKSPLDKFFSETEISSSPPKMLTLEDKGFPPIDERLAELKRKPLVEGDARLKGTPWENMPVTDQANLNEAAQLIFSNFGGFKNQVTLNQLLGGKVGILEKYLQDDIPGMLDVIKGVRRHAKPPPQLAHEPFGEAAVLAAADKIIAKQSRLPPFMRRWIDNIKKLIFPRSKGAQVHPL